MAWDPEQYLKFKQERFLPFEDLMTLVRVKKGMTAIDLGCGTGELTALLADRLPESRVLGVDSSPQMLEQAKKHGRPGLSFAEGTIETATGTYDLVFSHAAIHWVADHPSLIPRLLALVRPGGQLAVQLPANHRHPAHTGIQEIAGEAPFREALGGWVRHSPVLEIDTYAELLYRHGGRDVLVFEKVFPHLMPDADAVAEWTAGTTIVPYFDRLPAHLHEPFMDRYREKLRALWPAGPALYTFRRIFFSAHVP